MIMHDITLNNSENIANQVYFDLTLYFNDHTGLFYDGYASYPPLMQVRRFHGRRLELSLKSMR